MAKTKQRSAAQRREQMRQQRQQSTIQSTPRQSQNRNRRRVAQRRSPWLLIGGILVLVVIIVGIFYFVSKQSNTTGSSTSDPTVFNTITHIDPSLLASVGTGNAKNQMVAPKGSPPILQGPTGKPEFFYAGGEYCPFCAAQRWAIVVALSRFGTFSPLTQIQSSEGNYSTFTFHNSTYKSQYVDFAPVEISDQQQNPYEKLSSEQQQLFDTYDVAPYTNTPGAIPFIDIANQEVSSGAYYDPQVLNGLSWGDIATQIKDPSTNVSKGILGSANYLTAAVCAATKNQPASVCSTSTIQQIKQSLPKSALNAGGTQVATIGGQVVAEVPQQTRRRG